MYKPKSSKKIIQFCHSHAQRFPLLYTVSLRNRWIGEYNFEHAYAALEFARAIAAHVVHLSLFDVIAFCL